MLFSTAWSRVRSAASSGRTQRSSTAAFGRAPPRSSTSRPAAPTVGTDVACGGDARVLLPQAPAAVGADREGDLRRRSPRWPVPALATSPRGIRVRRRACCTATPRCLRRKPTQRGAGWCRWVRRWCPPAAPRSTIGVATWPASPLRNLWTGGYDVPPCQLPGRLLECNRRRSVERAPCHARGAWESGELWTFAGWAVTLDCTATSPTSWPRRE